MQGDLVANLVFHGSLLGDIKMSIRQAQTRTTLATHSELVHLWLFEIGQLQIALRDVGGEMVGPA